MAKIFARSWGIAEMTVSNQRLLDEIASKPGSYRAFGALPEHRSCSHFFFLHETTEGTLNGMGDGVRACSGASSGVDAVGEKMNVPPELRSQ